MSIQSFTNGESNGSVRTKINSNFTELDDRVTEAQSDADLGISGLESKVDKVAGKGLSTNDYTTAEKTKLSAISTSSQAEAQAGSENTKYMTALRVKEAILALTPTQSLNAETAVYIANIVAAGSSISQKQILAVDNLVTAGKKNGWFTKAKDIGPLCGTSLAGASVKLVSASGGNITWYNFVEADLSNNGLDPGVLPSTKYGDLGFELPSAGLSQTNVCLAVGFPYYSKVTTGVNGGAGYGPPITNYPSGTFTDGTLAQMGFNGLSSFLGTVVPFSPFGRTQLLNSSSAGRSSYSAGVEMTTEFVAATGQNVTGNMLLFKGKNSTTDFFFSKPIGIYVICSSLLLAERKALCNDMNDFLIATERLPNKPRYVAFGDSITQGGAADPTNTFRAFGSLAQKLGYIDYNLGRGSSTLTYTYTPTQPASDLLIKIPGGFQRYSDIINTKPDMLTSMYGTNDIGGDTYPGGVADPAILADMTTKLTTMLTNFISIGCRILILSPPWRATLTSKVQAYVKTQSDVCVAKGVPFVDTFNIFLDTGDPASYFPDGLHPNKAGYDLMIEHIMAGISGRLYRLPVLDFPSIAAGAFSDLTVIIYGARIGMEVSLGQPSVPTVGIIYQAFVSANDTVTVRAINITASSIDPASQVIKVTVTL